MNFLAKCGCLANFARPNLAVSSFLVEQKRFAARRGTREKKRKAHKKKVIEKTDWIPPSERKALLELQVKGATSRLKDLKTWPPADNVFRQSYYKRVIWPTVASATAYFRHYFHPTTRNDPNALISAYIELDLRIPKKSEAAMQRYIDPFGEMVSLPYHFDSPETRERPVLAFAKSTQHQEAALEGGATVAGGVPLIKEIQTGERDLHSFAYYVAHPDIVVELAALRGLMKKKYPVNRNGSLNTDLKAACIRFSRGLEYTLVKNQREPDLGALTLPIGRLLLSDEEIEANLQMILQSINKYNPRLRKGDKGFDWPFFTHVILQNPACKETFKLDHDALISKPLLSGDADTSSDSSDSSDDEAEEKAGAQQNA